MRIAVSNVVSEYSLGGVNFTHRVRDMMFESGTGYEVRDKFLCGMLYTV